MASFPGKLSLITATLSLALTGCSGSSSDDDDTTTTSLSCSAQINMADNDDGLTSNAGYQGLHYYALGSRLCAFDPLAGTGFEVDRVPEDNIDPVVTIYSKDGTGDLSVRGVVYPKGNALYFAAADEPSASAPPAPQQISSENNADMIDMMLTGIDRNGGGQAHIAYRIFDPEDSSTEWFSVSLDQGSSEAPNAFDEFQRPMGPVNDNSGAFTGWLVHHYELAQRDALVVVDASDPTDEISVAQGNLDSLLGTNVNYLVQLDNGDVVVSVLRSNETEFYYLDASTDEAEAVGTIDAEVGGMATAYGTNGEVLYVGQTIPDGNGGPDNEARLYRVNDEDPVDLLDRADVRDTFPAQVTATDFGVVWAWNTDISETGPSGVHLVDEGSDDEVTVVRENAGGDNELTFSSLARGAASNNVFFTENNATTGSEFTAYAVDTTQPDNLNVVVDESNAQWVSSSQPADSQARAGVVPPSQMSEVFLVENDNGTQRLFAYDAGTPSQSVELGTLNVDFNLPGGIPISPMVTSLGLGPYRLMNLAQADDELFIVDTRHADSRRNLAVQQDGAPQFRTFEGF